MSAKRKQRSVRARAPCRRGSVFLPGRWCPRPDREESLNIFTGAELITERSRIGEE